MLIQNTTYIDCHNNLRVKSETLVAMGKDSTGSGEFRSDADSSILADDTHIQDIDNIQSMRFNELKRE